MSLILRQTQATAQRIDLRGLLPKALANMPLADIQHLRLHQGNRRITLGDLFQVEQTEGAADTLTLVPLDGSIDHIGANLDAGEIIVQGDAGHYAGRAMSGGTLSIAGNAGRFAGSGLRGGCVRIGGDCGDMAAAPAAGERQGQQGGLIHIRGSVGARAGERLRRGTLLIDGDAGDLLGHRMIAGTIYVGGKAGSLAGHGMRRGSLLLRQPPAKLGATIVHNGRQQLPFLRLLLDELRRLSGDSIPACGASLTVQRYLGDLACAGRGEILILD